MDYTKSTSEAQDTIKIQSKIGAFFDKFNIGTLMNRCGIKKRHGHSIRSLTETIFTLPFIGKNFYRGIVINEDENLDKDAAYNFLKGETHNWRQLLLSLASLLFKVFDPLTNDDRESVLIIDDSTYDRSRSKRVELLSKVFGHSTRKFLKGFSMLTLCWSDGASILPLVFSLLSSNDPKNRLCESKKQMHKSCCACKRRHEVTLRTTGLLEDMLKRALKKGIHARYLHGQLVTMPATMTTLAKHIHII